MIDHEELLETGLVIILLLAVAVSCVGPDVVKLMKSAQCEKVSG